MSKKDLKDEELEEEIEDEKTEADTSESESSAEDVKTDTDKDDKEESNTNQKTDEESETGSHDDEDEKTISDEADKNDEDNESRKTVPYTRFKKVNDKYKAVKAELDALKGEETTANNNENNEEMLVETESDEEANTELEKYKTAFNDIFQSRLEQVPMEYQELIPEGDDLSKLKWIESAIAKGLFDKKVESFGNQGNNPAEQENQSNTAFIKSLGRKF